MSEQHDTRAEDDAATPAPPAGAQPSAKAAGCPQQEDEVQSYIQAVEAALSPVEDAQTRPARTVRNPVSG